METVNTTGLADWYTPRNLEIKQYLSSLIEFDASAVDVDFASALSLFGMLGADKFFSNSGAHKENYSSVSRTMLAHKILFDLNSQKSIDIFAQGLHPNIYDTDIVIDAFKKYIEFVMDKKPLPETDVAPIQLISKAGTDEDFDTKVLESRFLKEAVKLTEKYQRPLIDVYKFEDVRAKVRLKTIKIVEGREGENFALAVDGYKDISVADIDAFSIYGDGIRYRDRHSSNKPHFAYLNFGNRLLTEALKDNFSLIKDSAEKIPLH